MKIKKLTLNDKEQLNILIGKIEENLEKEDYWLPINEPSREHFFDEQWTEFYGMFDGDELIAAAALFYNEHEYGESVQVIGLECDRVAEIGRAMVAPSYRGNNYTQFIVSLENTLFFLCFALVDIFVYYTGNSRFFAVSY